jgi:WD40 repeat protein
LFSAATDQTIRCWNTDTWTTKRVLRGHGDEIHAVAVSQSGEAVVSICRTGNLIMWNTEQGRPDGGSIRLSEDPTVDQAWPLDDSRVLLLPPGRPPLWLDLKDDGAAVPLPELGSSSNVLGCFDGKILCCWDEADRILVYEWQGTGFRSRGGVVLDNNTRPTGIAYNSLHHVLAWAETGSPNSVYLADVDAPGRRVELKSDVPGLIPIQFCKSGNYLLGHAEQRSILRLWHIETGQITVSLDGHVSRAVFAAHGRVLVTGGYRSGAHEHEITFYDLTGSNRAGRRIPGRGAFHRLAVSPDGNMVAVPTSGGEVRLFDPIKGELIVSLHSHMNGTNNVAFSPDGRRLISVGNPGEIKLWDVATHRELLTLRSSGGHEQIGRWTSDGRAIVHGAQQAWHAPTLDEIAATEAVEQTEGRQL